MHKLNVGVFCALSLRIHLIILVNFLFSVVVTKKQDEKNFDGQSNGN